MNKAPYDERNQADYLAISQKIEEALRLISDDQKLPATEVSLANLAGCSRGTLRNRVYPLERLRAIKKQRSEQSKAKNRSVRVSAAHRVSVEVHIDEKKRLVWMLEKSRSEIAVWEDRCSELEKEIEGLNRVKDFLLQSREIPKEGIDELQGVH